MSETLQSYTSKESIDGLVECFTEEAERQNRRALMRGYQDDYATALSVGRSMYSDDHKDIHGVRWVPATDDVRELAEAYARMRWDAEQSRLNEIDEREEAERLERELRKPSAPFTIGDLFPA